MSTLLQSYPHHHRNAAGMHWAAEREGIYWRAYSPYSKYSRKNRNDTFLHTCNTLLLSVLPEQQTGCLNRQPLRNPEEEGWWCLSVRLSRAGTWVSIWSSKSLMISRRNNCSPNYAVLRQRLRDMWSWTVTVYDNRACSMVRLSKFHLESLQRSWKS